jgi:hypothetical protein
MSPTLSTENPICLLEYGRKLKNKSEHKYINSSFFHLTIETETKISAGVFRRQTAYFA